MRELFVSFEWGFYL